MSTYCPLSPRSFCLSVQAAPLCPWAFLSYPWAFPVLVGFMGLGPLLWTVLMAVSLLFISLHLCSPLPSSQWPSTQVSLPPISVGSCAQGCLGRAVAWGGRGGGLGVGSPSNAAPSSHQHSPRGGAPIPNQYGLPLPRLPSLLAHCLPPSLPPARPPPCLLPSSLSPQPPQPSPPPPVLQDPARAAGGQAGGQAGGGLRGETKRWRQQWRQPAAGRQAQPGTGAGGGFSSQGTRSL